MKKKRVLVLLPEGNLPPDDIHSLSEKQFGGCKTEYDVLFALRELEHEVTPLEVGDDLSIIRDALAGWKPHIVFNLLEEFSGLGTYVPYVLGYLELQGTAYTGCNPRGLILSDNKALMRKILKHHRIPMPNFQSMPRGRKIRPSRHLRYPVIVKSSTEHGSVGISQASVVYDNDKLVERVGYIHEKLESDAIAEEYIEGRELYMGLLGHRRVQTLPMWELMFKNPAEGAHKIATAKVKWDEGYQVARGITSGLAKNIPEAVADRAARVCKRVYRILGLSSYARMDFRLTPDDRIFLLEPNPNPDIASDQEFAESAAAAGTTYNDLINRILNLGMSYHRNRFTWQW